MNDMHLPDDINLNRQEHTLELVYPNGARYTLSCEFLRVHSPSAEVRGHGNEVLQTGKKLVNINAIEQVGNYAIKITFDDKHDTGLYSWDYLHELCLNQDALWQRYLDKLADAGAKREPDLIGRWKPGS